MRVRKLPVIVEARQLTDKSWYDIEVWCGGYTFPYRPSIMQIATLEGTMRAMEGDWIIQGVKGEFYPCAPDIFKLTYEIIEEDENRN